MRGVPTVVCTTRPIQSTPDHGAGSSSLAAQAFLVVVVRYKRSGKGCLIGHRLDPDQRPSNAACCSFLRSTCNAGLAAKLQAYVAEYGAQALPQDYDAQPAAAKLDLLWKNIENTRCGSMPLTLLALRNARYCTKKTTNRLPRCPCMTWACCKMDGLATKPSS